MRITFITPAADRSGGARVIDVYARALQARGHDVCVVTCPVARSLKNRIAGFLEDGKLRPATSTSDSHIREGAYEIRIAAPWKPIGPECVPDADVVIATFFVTANWVARYPASKGKKVHFVQHYELFDGVTKQELDASLRLPLTKITISTWLAKVLADLGAAADVVIPNSVDTKLFSAPPRRRQAAPTVGIMHSTASYKDTGTGLRAFELLRRKMPDVRLVAFGTSPPRGSLSLPRDAKFVLRPPQDQIQQIYASTDVWMCSSKAEGFGLPVLEAMACRCPAVSTAVGGPIDFMTDGVEGFLVPTEDPAALADGLERVLRLPEDQWVRMSEAAYLKANSYTWDDAADRFEAALKSIVDRVSESAPAKARERVSQAS